MVSASLSKPIVDPKVRQMFSSLHQVIGNTPLLALTFSFAGTVRTVYAKAEYLNITGSIKDRMALQVLESAYRDGSMSPGDVIVEATSGNTGIAFAALGKSLGHMVVIYIPDWMSQERISLIKSYGASVVPVSHAQGGFLGSIRMTEEHTECGDKVFLPKQFENVWNPAAHSTTTGPEIRAQLTTLGLTPDAFVAGVGTGGTIMGVADDFHRFAPGAKIYPVEPAESPTLSTGYKTGTHRIQGISDEFVPSIVDLNTLDEVLAVSDGDSILMAQKLSSTLGLGVGISSGCNFLAAIMAQERLHAGAVVATIFCDDNKKYMSTGLFREEKVKETYLSQHVELLEFKVVSRTMHLPADTWI